MDADPRLPRDAPYPWVPFFKRAEELATAAFQAIPFVGDGVADFFNSVVVPRCTPPRDRALGLIRRGFKSIEGRLAVALLRLMPLPSPKSEVRSPKSTEDPDLPLRRDFSSKEMSSRA